MARDFYQELGVSRSASGDDIRKAYRKLAAELHPDRNQNNPSIEDRFKRVNSAYHVLSDEKKRKLYDRYGEAGLREGFNPAAGGFGGFGGGGGGRTQFEDIFGGAAGGVGDLFGDLFGGARGRRPRKAPDMESEITIEFLSAVRGAELELDVAGRHVKVRIPKGADNGDKLRVKGGGTAAGAAGAADLLLVLKVKPHPLFERDGLDLTVDVPINVGEAHFGCKIEVPTLESSVQLKVPPGAQSGQMVRLRGKGVNRGKDTGDLYVRFLVKLPAQQSDAIDRAVHTLAEATSGDLREHLKL